VGLRLHLREIRQRGDLVVPGVPHGSNAFFLAVPFSDVDDHPRRWRHDRESVHGVLNHLEVVLLASELGAGDGQLGLRLFGLGLERTLRLFQRALEQSKRSAWPAPVWSWSRANASFVLARAAPSHSRFRPAAR